MRLSQPTFTAHLRSRLPWLGVLVLLFLGLTAATVQRQSNANLHAAVTELVPHADWIESDSFQHRESPCIPVIQNCLAGVTRSWQAPIRPTSEVIDSLFVGTGVYEPELQLGCLDDDSPKPRCSGYWLMGNIQIRIDVIPPDSPGNSWTVKALAY